MGTFDDFAFDAFRWVAYTHTIWDLYIFFPSLVEFLGVDLHFYEVFESQPSHAPSEESNESHDSWSPIELTYTFVR